MQKILELRKKLAELYAKMTALVQKADGEKRALTQEEDAEWNRMDDDYLSTQREIERLEKLEKRRVELETLDPRRGGREPGTPAAGDEIRRLEREAFLNFIRVPAGEWTPEIREIILRRRAEVPPEVRALGLTGAAGGFTVPQEFLRELERAMKDFSGILQACRILRTTSGAAMPMPTVNDTGNKGRLLAEGGAAAVNVDPTFAAVTLDAFVYTSEMVKIWNALLQDSAFELETEVRDMLAERFGRILNEHGTIGDGVNKPRGIVTAVLAGAGQVAAGSATAIAYGDFVELEHAVDPKYRAQNPAWMMHDSILKTVKKLLDANGLPLWSGSMKDGQPQTILGYPFFINQDMDAAPLAAAKESVLFGNFKKYVVRMVQDTSIIVVRERYAEEFMTGVCGFSRWDSDLVDAGTKPIRVLQH